MLPETSTPLLQMEWWVLLFHYWPVFVSAFAMAIVVTPIMRFTARATGIVDRPDEARKIHTKPIAYLGGVGVLIAVLSGIIVSYTLPQPSFIQPFPLVVILGMFAIGLTGLADDVKEYFDPWWKIAGQFIAAAAMAQQGVGTRVAEGFLRRVLHIPSSVCDYPLISPIDGLLADPITVTYITGILIIAAFILGACNAANLIDGLDGLLSGVVAITCIGFIAITLIVLKSFTVADLENIQAHLPLNTALSNRGEGITLLGANLVLSVSLLGAVLGFLIYNFNPASIFLGDAGSLLLGYLCIVMALMLGEKGETFIVVAGLIVFALPILDTLLAILRRKLAGKAMSEPDSNHIHHILKRKFKSVKKTVFALYGVSSLFCLLGVLLVLAHTTRIVGAWLIYLIAIMIFGGISFVALKAARKHEEAHG